MIKKMVLLFMGVLLLLTGCSVAANSVLGSLPLHKSLYVDNYCGSRSVVRKFYSMENTSRHEAYRLLLKTEVPGVISDVRENCPPSIAPKDWSGPTAEFVPEINR